EADVAGVVDDLAVHDVFDDEMFDLEQWVGGRGLQHHAGTAAGISIGWKQANWCAGVSAAVSSGFSPRQRGTAYRQRGEKEQPLIGRVGSGGRPEIAGSSVCGAASSFGIAASSASV